jgi:phosphoribosyl-ATP pyrophosphohydrolase
LLRTNGQESKKWLSKNGFSGMIQRQFYGALPMPDSVLSQLEAIIARRRDEGATAEKSYVASLLQKGLPKIGAKITEEAAEVVEAAGEPGPEGRDHLVREVADLIFHTLVLLGHAQIGLDQVEAELARRFGVSGHAEKAARQGPKKPND